MDEILKIDEMYMSQCLSLAEKGVGYVSPNPMVGALIVKNGKIIAEGYHKQFGGPHAEVVAIKSATSSLKNSTLYVNLEPCCYYGKTPPCTDLIISSGIKKVKIGMIDPNPLVSGKGVKKLKKAGIEVTVGILNDECKKLNEAFSKYITTGFPFVTIKVAQTIDGKIADVKNNSKWITNQLSRHIVHKLRSVVDAVIVGTNTINIDNPILNTHLKYKRNPIRVILDGNLNVNVNANIFSDKTSKTLIITSLKSFHTKKRKKDFLVSRGIEVVALKSNDKSFLDLGKILKELGKRQIASILVEGGASVFSHFLKNKYVDKLLIFIAPKILGQGLSSFEYVDTLNINKIVKLTNIQIKILDSDILLEGYVERSRL